MNRSIHGFQCALLGGLGLALVACEDGPTQVFSASPSTASSRWNDGKTPSAVDNSATQSFVGVLGGKNKQEICTGPEKAARWAAMVKEPIAPPRTGGGLDLAGGESWQGLTIEEAEKINCQSDNLGDQFGDGTQVNSWGDNGELWIQYRVSTRKALQLTFFPGYVGTMDFHSKDNAHKYTIGISIQVQKDGKPLVLDWVGNNGDAFRPVADELYRAMMATYQPGLPEDAAGVNCLDTGRCIKGSFGDIAYFYIPSTGWALWIDNQNAPQPTPSIPTRIDQSPAKIMAYAYANPLLKLDKEGPIAMAGKLNKNGSDCTLKMGLNFKDFLANCVQVSGNADVDKVEFNKLVGGLSHDTEKFTFDVQGVDINFSDSDLKPDDIVHDNAKPSENDVAGEFGVDQSTLGTLQNDVDAAGKPDLHGAGAVYKEYLRQARKRLLELDGVKDGDTSKCLFPVPAPANFDPEAFMAALPPYCTGMEGMITAAPSTGPKDVNNIGFDGATAVYSAMSIGLKLGHQKVMFCADANGDINTGYLECGAPYGASGDIFATSFSQVLKVYGKGKLSNMPEDVQDVRFFFKMYVIAFARYLLAGDQNPVPDLSDAKYNIDPDSLFFDSVGAGQFEIGEYIDRRFASKTLDPIDFTIVADVKNGIFSSYNFSRDIYRGETAVYAAMQEDKTHGPGQDDNAKLTNIFGSPVLKNGWAASSKGKSAFECATADPPMPDQCDGQTPPLDAAGNTLKDELGRPILLGYPGAFSQGVTAFGLGPSQITILQTFPSIQSAKVRVPTPVNPYDMATWDPKDPNQAMEVLIPWVPKQPGTGFHIPLTGTLDKFVTTAQMDFTGNTISANVNYDAQIDDKTHQPKADGSIQLLSVETTDFLGEVFLCQDANTGDLLRARMYTPVAEILTWLSQHPSAYASCGMVLTYSPFNNFVDYITSLANGVRLGVTQGGGFGRVVDVTLFVPGQ